MPKAAPRPCTFPGCRAYSVYRGRCDEHKEVRWTKSKNRLSGWDWAKVRPRILARDGHLCQSCLQAGRYTQATEVDHVIPLSKGGSNDDDNLMALCHTCHGLKTATERHISRKKIRKPAIPVTLVCGPPGAGKTTYCLQHRQSGDQIIDLDMIVEELSGNSRTQVDTSRYVRQAICVRNWRLDALADAGQGRAWVTMSLPKLAEREEWQGIMNADVIMLDPGHYECLRRIEQDATRSPLERAKSIEAAGYWYSVYSRREGDSGPGEV